MNEEQQKQTARDWFEELRNRICAAFEAIEDDATLPFYQDQEPGRFVRTAWDRPGGGGGVMAVMRGRVFEKVGVNVSTVHGEFSEAFRKQIPGADQDGKFWASGISLVAHLRSPLCPPAHMNTRHIRTTKTWFGGGGDLNPIYPQDADTADFHGAFERACDSYEDGAYQRFKEWADDYFFIPHRNEPRGVGGIFYDYLEGDFERHLAFTQEVGKAFLEIYPQLIRRHLDEPWTDEQREYQLMRRGRYAEFNLVYDRGTQFGLKTGGNTEAILMSLPPIATWP